MIYFRRVRSGPVYQQRMKEHRVAGVHVQVGFPVAFVSDDAVKPFVDAALRNGKLVFIEILLGGLGLGEETLPPIPGTRAVGARRGPRASPAKRTGTRWPR